VIDAVKPPPLVVPASAVLITGKRAVVYVRVPKTEKPTFEGREIVLGPRAGDSYIVSEGLQEDDIVVTNGNFKIDSALQLQAKPSMMTTKDTTAKQHAKVIFGEQTHCPVMGGPINKEIFVEYKGKKVYFCCGGCDDVFLKEPEKYLPKLPQFQEMNTEDEHAGRNH
jgi:YHS domain-containing protein